MSNLNHIKIILDDADVCGYISACKKAILISTFEDGYKAPVIENLYDDEASFISEKLSADLSLEQIQNLIWLAFYKKIAENELFPIDKKSAILILGESIRFKDLSAKIRQLYLK